MYFGLHVKCHCLPITTNLDNISTEFVLDSGYKFRENYYTGRRDRVLWAQVKFAKLLLYLNESDDLCQERVEYPRPRLNVLGASRNSDLCKT
jgi:hypothetical protein